MSDKWNELQGIALSARRNTLLQIYEARSGHPGGSLSLIDILSFLYKHELLDPMNINQVILSKGHAAPAWYAVAAEFGLVNKADLISFRKINSNLQGHPHIGSTPWVGTSTGSLGQGFSVSIGMALGLRHKNIDHPTYVILGDGELQEGQVWEAAMSAAHYNLDKLCAIIDYNKLQSDDKNENIMSLKGLMEKWLAFNWNVIEIDGHSFDEIEAAFNFFKQESKKPTVIIAHTIKGKGISFMENVPAWHGSVTMSEEEFSASLAELGVPSHDVGKYLDGTIWSKS